MKTSSLVLLATVTLCSSALVKPPSGSGNFELLILHNNDMHARFEQTSRLSGACTAADREAGKCYGGFPRVAHVVKEARMAAQSGQGPPVLYLNAGDTYTGTAWFTIYKWKIAAEFINALQPDAVSLGNNELGKESADLSPFLEHVHTTILASNVVLKSAQDNRNVQKSVIIDVEGVKVGLVGYLTPNSELLDTTGDVEYIDEVIALKEEVKQLKSLDVSIIIALGHSNLKKDIEIARDVEDLDLVIAGNTNKFYWDGNTDDNSDNKDPIIVTQESGRKVPVIISSSYNKYLGKVMAKFDTEGEIINYNSEPILLDSTVPQDEEALQILKSHNNELTAKSQRVIGKTAVVLDGESCKTEECNLGNLIADAIIYYYATRFEGTSPWTDASIAIIPGGDIAGSIAPSNRPADITLQDLLNAIPTEGNIVRVTMSGTVLNAVLEHSVATYSTENPTGQLLQFSGIRAEYDLSKESGSRLVNSFARCSSCFVPEYYVIENSRNYSVLMPASLANGAYGYNMFHSLVQSPLPYDEVTSAAEFIELRSPVYPEVAGRVVLTNYEGGGNNANGMTSTILITVLLPVALLFRNSLGNHEFDNGVSGLTPFIQNLTCPVVAANLILNKEPDLESEPNLMKSVVFDVNGTKVGVIGYLTPDTKVLAIRNKVDYIEEVKAIKTEAAKLKNEGINILIALGHSGFTKDLQIAKEVEEIDLVIGGHTNTFLWNGTTPDLEKAEGPYPMIVKQKSGRLVPAVQAYAYTKYLGKLHLIFDANGEIISYDGNPILLDNTIPQDPEVLEIVNLYRDEVMKISDVVVGTTSVMLDGHSCRLTECNMGNLITDAMVFKYANMYRGKGWTDAPIAIIQGGGVRASIAHLNLPANVTKGDLLTVMPYDGNMVRLTINGRAIMRMLEHSVAGYYPNRAPGQFLQMSGLKVEYDLRNLPGYRVVKVSVRCGLCDLPSFSALNKSEEYNILMPSFLSMGGDGFSIFDGLPAFPLSYDELESTIEYLAGHSPIYTGLQDRIVIKNVDRLRVNGVSHFGLSLSVVMIALIAVLL